MATKCYYLFGIRVWTVIDDTDLEEEEALEADSPLTVQSTIADGNPPGFGFTPWTPDYMDWKHTE